MSGGPMLLGVDASTGVCSVALTQGEHVIGQSHTEGLGHAATLLTLAEQLLAQAGVARGAIDAIVCTRGPGGFTGVRISVGVAQGLALGLDRPVITLSTLQVLAETALQSAPAGHLDGCLVLQDARMQEVYGGLFRCNADQYTEALGEEWLGVPEIPAMPDGRWCGVGSGFAVHADALDGVSQLVAIDAQTVPLMSAAMPLARRHYKSGDFIDGSTIEPTYLRNRVAAVPEVSRRGV